MKQLTALLLLAGLLAVCVVVAQAYEEVAVGNRGRDPNRLPMCPKGTKPPGYQPGKKFPCKGPCRVRRISVCKGGGRLRGVSKCCALDILDGDGWGWNDW